MTVSQRFVRHRTSFLSLLLLAGLAAGCTNDKIVFRDREPFNAPPEAARGFLGYFTANEKQTTCGNCHVGQQSEWVATRHADAYATLLEASGGNPQDFCVSCHSVNEQGNAITDSAGWHAVRDTVYHDVQCESCHGPGLDHVQNPDATQPIASIRAAVGENNGCGECHSGVHHPFVEEWAASGHATPVADPVQRAQQNPATYGNCLDCHTAQGALRAWGVNAEYAEQDAPTAEHLGIVCAVCHDPHGGGEGTNGQLRYAVDVPSQEANLCMKCHHKRAEPETQSATIRGPHSPEGPLLLGEGAGWFPPGFEPRIDRILGTHGTTANPRLCATCHVDQFEVTDSLTGEFVFAATGHRFLAIPCLDARGVPSQTQDCTDLTQRSFQACVTSGCHGSEEAARSAYVTATQRLEALAAEVDALLQNPAVAGDFVLNDGRFTIPDGAWFNAQLARIPGSQVHNPFLIEQLLVASINALRTTYGLSGPTATGVSLRLEL